MDLRRSESDAGVLDHRLHHIIDQCLNCKTGQAFLRQTLCLQPQDRMSEPADF